MIKEECTVIPESLTKLCRYVVKAFYEPVHVVLVEYLIGLKYVKKEELTPLLGLEKKKINSALNELESAHLVVKTEHQEKTDEEERKLFGKRRGGRSTKTFYYALDYQYMRASVTSRLKELQDLSSDVKLVPEYACTECHVEIDAHLLGVILMENMGVAKCNKYGCNGTFAEKKDIKNNNLHSKAVLFNQKIAKITAMLMECKNIKLMHSALPSYKDSKEGKRLAELEAALSGVDNSNENAEFRKGGGFGYVNFNKGNVWDGQERNINVVIDEPLELDKVYSLPNYDDYLFTLYMKSLYYNRIKDGNENGNISGSVNGDTNERNMDDDDDDDENLENNATGGMPTPNSNSTNTSTPTPSGLDDIPSNPNHHTVEEIDMNDQDNINNSLAAAIAASQSQSSGITVSVNQVPVLLKNISESDVQQMSDAEYDIYFNTAKGCFFNYVRSVNRNSLN